MSIFLERINSAPLLNSDLPTDFVNWVSTFVDSMNETIEDIQNNFNTLVIPPTLSADIVTASVNASNGTFWYASDATPPCLVSKVGGALVKLTTTAFP